MSDPGIVNLLELVSKFGVLGLVIFLWWHDNRRVYAILAQYKNDMAEQRKMYESNVSLCRDFASVTKDLRDIVTLNIQKMTELGDAVEQNQFCPMMRVEKKTVKVVEDRTR